MTPSLVTPLASVTDFIVDPIVDAATEFIDAVGLIGVFILMLLESACIPTPLTTHPPQFIDAVGLIGVFT